MFAVRRLAMKCAHATADCLRFAGRTELLMNIIVDQIWRGPLDSAPGCPGGCGLVQRAVFD